MQIIFTKNEKIRIFWAVLGGIYRLNCVFSVVIVVKMGKNEYLCAHIFNIDK